jgi:hypothetical protein
MQSKVRGAVFPNVKKFSDIDTRAGARACLAQVAAVSYKPRRRPPPGGRYRSRCRAIGGFLAK